MVDLAGMQDVQPQVQQLLQQHLGLTSSRVHSLRVFALTQHQPDSSADAAAAASPPQNKHISSSSSSSATNGTSPEAAAAAAAGAEVQCSTTSLGDVPQGMLWAELKLLGGLPASQLKAAAKAVSCCSSAEQPQGNIHQSACPSWLLLRRRDAAVLLLGSGLARLSPPEDFEWLGVSPAAVKAFTR
jgi:hypothetical protein